MAGVGDSWGTREELLHPRDKHGRFRSKWKMAEGVVNKILAALAAFNPRQFQSDGQASQYLHNKAKPSRFGGGNGYARLSADFDAANDALRAGSMDASTQKFVKMMDDSAIDLPDDIIVSRRVGPEAFGLTPETMGLDEGGLEDFTGKLIADRGYGSANIGTPMGTAPIQISIAVPKGTKVIIPGRSQNDRQIYTDRDQEIRVTKVDPDGRGGFYVLAVATQRTPGETPAPVGGPGAPGDVTARESQVEQGRQLGLKGMKAPDDAQSAQHGTPRQRQEQGLAPNPADLQGPVDTGPGGPPPRNEPVVTEALGQGGAPQAPAPAAGAPAAPGGAPETPIREADFKEAAKALPIPSAGKRRREWNAAYLGVRSGKRDPDDLLRELDRDIEVNKGTLADQKSRGDSSDPQLADDITAQEKLADLIRTHHDIDGKTSDETIAPTPEPVKAAKKAAKAAPAKKAAAPVKAAPVKKASREDRVAKLLLDKLPPDMKARVLADMPEADRREVEAGVARVEAAGPSVKAIPTPTSEERRDIAKLDLSEKKEYRALRREGKSHADALQGARDRNLPTTPAAPVVAKKAVPAERPMTLAEAKRQTALDAVRENPIDDPTADTTYKRITKGLEDNTMTVAKARREALDSARYFHESATTVGKNGMTTPEKRGAAHASETAKATKYEKLAEALQVSQGTLKTDKYRRPSAPAPKKSVEGAAPGTAAGKITSARLTPGTTVLVQKDSSGAWRPTTRKTGATKLAVTGNDALSGRGGRRQISGTGPDGEEIKIDVAPSQTFIVDQPKVTSRQERTDAELADIRDKLEGPELSRQERLDIESRLGRLNRIQSKAERKPTDDEILGMTKLELIAEAKRRGLTPRSYMNKDRLKELIQNEDKLDTEIGPVEPGTVRAQAIQNNAEGLNVTVTELNSIADSEGVPRRGRPKNKAALQDAIRARREEKANLTPEDQAIIDSLGDGPSAPPVVANPVAQKVIQAPDRAADFRLAWHRGGDFKETGSVGRQLDEVRDDIGSGKVTPDEGIRRLENEIGFNKDELTQMDADLRGDLGEEQRHLLKQKRDALAKGIRTQEKASTFLRTHFKKEPLATPDEIKVELDEAGQRALDDATPEGLREAALAQGIKVKGETKEEILKDLVRQMAGKELERRAAKVAPAPKAPDKPKPNLETSPYQRIDTQALAEGLDLRTEWDQRMMARVQAQLDGEDTSLGKNPTPAQIGRNLESWANGPAGPFYESATMQVTREDKRDAAWHAKHDALRTQGQEWLKLADRLKNTRRRKKEDRTPDVTPTVTRDEKKVIADVAEVTGIPAPQLEAKALAKKKAEAPPKQSAVQVAETLKTVGSRDEAKTLLQGRTKAELQEIAKATGTPVGSSLTKPKIIDAITETTVGGRLNFEVLTRGGMRGDTFAPPKHSRADLEDMSLVDLVDLEDELGIQRASLNRGDRIDAILAKQAGPVSISSPSLAEFDELDALNIDQQHAYETLRQQGLSHDKALAGLELPLPAKSVAPLTPPPKIPVLTLTPRSDISVHGDSQLGQLWDRLPKNDQEQIRIANRINDLGIDLSVRRKDDASAPQDVIDSLGALMATVTDQDSRVQIDNVIKGLSVPSVKVPDSPALSGSPPSIQTMVQSLAKIPVARRTGRMPSGGRRQTSVLDEVLRLIQDIDEGKAERNPDSKLHDLLRAFHESVEGAYQMWNLEPLIRTQEVRKWILSKRRQ